LKERDFRVIKNPSFECTKKIPLHSTSQFTSTGTKAEKLVKNSRMESEREREKTQKAEW
jgi:hypothetical protein